MKAFILILVGVAAVLAYIFDFKWVEESECKNEFPYCVKVEEKVR